MPLAAPRARRSVLAALAATTALAGLTATPAANAAFTIPRCSGSEIVGRGASFQQQAHNATTGWINTFRTTSGATACNGHPLIQYNQGPAAAVTGSGAGRGAMGSGESSGSTGLQLQAGQRDNTVRFGATDEGPSLASQQNMNAGILGNDSDDGQIHVIPTATAALVQVVNYPKWNADLSGDGSAEASCPLPPSYSTAGDAGVTAAFARLRVPNWKLERVWSGGAAGGTGGYSTWGEFLEDPDGAGPLTGLGNDPSRPGTAGDLQTAYDDGCTNRKLIRAVRQDNSGTTFAFKDFLDYAAQITKPGGSTDVLAGTASATDWNPGFTSSSTLNRRWPNTSADNDPAGAPAGTRPTGNTDYSVRFTNDLQNNDGDIADVDNLCEADYVANAARPVCRSATTGNPGVREVVRKNNGSIGYMDLATAVQGTGEFRKADDVDDTTYMLQLAEQSSTTSYVEPSKNPEGYKVGQATQGSNCDDVPVRNQPIGTIPTIQVGWEPVTMVFPAIGAEKQYNDCTLTYILAWDDNAPVYLALPGNTYAQEQARARALKDYLTFIVSDAGQATLQSSDYSPLPNTVAPGAPSGTVSALAAARKGVESIDWDKKGIGNQNTGGNTTNGGGGNTTPPPTNTETPPPPISPPVTQGPPSNAFTITSARVQGRSSILASLQLPGPGTVQVTAVGTYTAVKAKKKKKRRKARAAATVTVGRATVTVTRSGAQQVRLPLSAAAKRALAKTNRMSVRINVVFTPTGGTANTVTRTLTLRGARKK